MIKLLTMLTVCLLTHKAQGQSRVAPSTNISPLQLDLLTRGVDLRSTDSLGVAQRVEDAKGSTWFIRQQGSLFALYPRGIGKNAAGLDQVPPGTRWFIGFQNLEKALGFSTDRVPSQDRRQKSPDAMNPTFPLTPFRNMWGSENPSADRWLIDEGYRRRATSRWIQTASLR